MTWHRRINWGLIVILAALLALWAVVGLAVWAR